MDLGKKVASLRKKNNLTQESLAEKIGVTRQTISKWELGETSPDIKQAKLLAAEFNISLDELVNNNTNNVLMKKVSNTEHLATITIKMLKVIGIILSVLFITIILLIVTYGITHISSKDNKISGKFSLDCHLDNEEYLYEIEYNKNYQIINGGGDAWISNHTDVENYDDANKAVAHIEDYFNDHKGSCIISEETK